MSRIQVLDDNWSVIVIIDECINIYSSALKSRTRKSRTLRSLELSARLRSPAGGLPLTRDTLQVCKDQIQTLKSTVPQEIYEALEGTLNSCDQKASRLQTLLKDVLPGETDHGWAKHYWKTV